MAEVVEGDWKDFRFKMAQPEDYPEILEHLTKNFYRDEPLCKHLGYDDQVGEDFNICVLEALNDKLSFIVIHKPTNKLAAVRITTLVNRRDKPEFPEFKSAKCSTIINFLTKATVQANVFDKYPDVDEFADFFMASVDGEFRGQGLATEMYERAIRLFKGKGIRLCKSVLTSPFTRKAGVKLGFTELSRLYLRDYKDDIGNLYFPNADQDEIITVVAFRIQ